jgi:cobalt-zinc-cadmium efflux system outer membrane protein
MRYLVLRFSAIVLAAACLAGGAYAQQKTYTWQELRQRFETSNQQLLAGRLGIDESKADEITAYLRPNPDLTFGIDQIAPFQGNPYRPLGLALPLVSSSYLHERQHKRELRLESAKEATGITESQQSDLERTLLFNLRNAFVQTLQAKAVLAVANENLAYYDHVLEVNRQRVQAGDVAQVDLDRMELQRVQFETDVQTGTVNLRTAKIQLLALMNDKTPVEQFDVTGVFDYAEPAVGLEELRRVALVSRPDLLAAVQAVTKAKTDHRLAIANGSTDPTFGVDLARNPPLAAYLGFNVNIPLRIFDRNQGEKEKTLLDITRNERLRDSTETQVYSDVDSAWATLNSTLNLLRPYKAKYIPLAAKVRETVSFSYGRGAASLLDFLNAQNDYRSVQMNYLNLVGSYMTAASQVNLAVGREEIQ